MLVLNVLSCPPLNYNPSLSFWNMTRKLQPFMTLSGKRISNSHQGKTSIRADCSHTESKFPPLKRPVSLSYPYSEEYTKPTQYMNTRCPAWCDRILMSHSAQEFIPKVSKCDDCCIESWISCVLCASLAFKCTEWHKSHLHSCISGELIKELPALLKHY